MAKGAVRAGKRIWKRTVKDALKEKLDSNLKTDDVCAPSAAARGIGCQSAEPPPSGGIRTHQDSILALLTICPPFICGGTLPKRGPLNSGIGVSASPYWNAVSKINTIATHPFGGVTTDAIGEKLPLDLSEHYRPISSSPLMPVVSSVARSRVSLDCRSQRNLSRKSRPVLCLYFAFR